MSDDVFYFFQGDDTHGPFTVTQLRQQVLSGKLHAETLVCKAGEEHWVRLAEHDSLCPQLSGAIAEYRHKSDLRVLMNRLVDVDMVSREATITHLSETMVYYRCKCEICGPITLWQVLDLMDSSVLPLETEVCLKGADYWREALLVCAKMCCVPAYVRI